MADGRADRRDRLRMCVRRGPLRHRRRRGCRDGGRMLRVGLGCPRIRTSFSSSGSGRRSSSLNPLAKGHRRSAQGEPVIMKTPANITVDMAR